MKEFWIYTGLRVLLFLLTWAAITALWVLATGSASGGLTAIIAFVVSGIGSYVVLRGPRERFARRVETRASNATAAVVSSPGHMGDHDPVRSAPHPWGVGLEHGDRGAQVQRPPASPTRPRVIARRATSTPPTPATLRTHGPHVNRQHRGGLIEHDPLDHRSLDPEQTPP